MNSEILNDEMLRRYLLDDVSDDERQQIEERFFEDDALFEDIAALEDELHYEYKQNRLNARERYHFERKFLRSEQDLEKSAFAAAFLQATAELAEAKSPARKVVEDAPGSFWQSIAAFFSFNGSAMRFGLSAAVILLACGLGFLLFKNAELRREMASLEDSRTGELREQQEIIAEKEQRQSELERQLAAEKSQGEHNEKRIAGIESEREKLQQEIAETRRRVNQATPIPIPPSPKNPQPQRSFIALVLSPGSFTRENGEGMKQVKISPAVKNLQLRLLSEERADFQTYRATLKTLDDGIEVWKSVNLKPRGTGAKKSFSLNIPANILQRADYELVLTGVTANGETEEITNYYFSILK